VQTLLDFYISKEIFNSIRFDEVVLEATVHVGDSKLFEYIANNYHGELPQVCLQTIVFCKNEELLKILLETFSDKFRSSD